MLARYGAEPGKTSYANNCLVARRLAERGVRFIQLYLAGDGISMVHPRMRGSISVSSTAAGETDQPTAALLKDLKSRGLLEDTLVIWGGEFGRTPMEDNYGGSTEVSKESAGDYHTAAFTHLDDWRWRANRAWSMARLMTWATRS